MNFLFYVGGAVLTFLGIIVYRFFQNSGVLTLTQASVFDVAITAGIAGIAFFITDYIGKKNS